MKTVIQRVLDANVEVEKQIVGKIDKGLVILIGISDADTTKDIDNIVKKIISLRIFSDENNKMNLSLQDIQGEILAISQFTLFADCHKGNRPSFTNAGKPDYAKKLYEYFIQKCKEQNIKIESGIFGADMKVNLTNDGPVTIILES